MFLRGRKVSSSAFWQQETTRIAVAMPTRPLDKMCALRAWSRAESLALGGFPGPQVDLLPHGPFATAAASPMCRQWRSEDIGHSRVRAKMHTRLACGAHSRWMKVGGGDADAPSGIFSQVGRRSSLAGGRPRVSMYDSQELPPHDRGSHAWWRRPGVARRIESERLSVLLSMAATTEVGELHGRFHERLVGKGRPLCMDALQAPSQSPDSCSLSRFSIPPSVKMQPLGGSYSSMSCVSLPLSISLNVFFEGGVIALSS